MGNCLVTKLKGVVDNDNLEKLNAIVVHCLPVESPSVTTMIMKVSGATSAKIISGDALAHFTDENGVANYGTEVINGQTGMSSGTFFVSNHDCKVAIEGKYNFTMLDFDSAGTGAANHEFVSGFNYIGVNGQGLTEMSMMHAPASDTIDTSSFFSTSKFKKLQYYTPGSGSYTDFSLPSLAYPDIVEGIMIHHVHLVNVSSLKACKNVNALTFSNVTGNIPFSSVEDFAGFNNLAHTLITVRDYFPFAGQSLERLVQVLRSGDGGRQSFDNLQMEYFSWLGLSFDGVEYANRTENYTATVSWTATTITFTYNGVTKTVNA